MTTATASATLLADYRVDEPKGMVLDRVNQRVRVWLSFNCRVPADALSVWIGTSAIHFEIESRGDVEAVFPGKCVWGLRFTASLAGCIPAIREYLLPIDFKVYSQVVLRLSLGAAPALVFNTMSMEWE